MPNLEHIAVYLPDGGASDPGLQNAVALATPGGARLTLLGSLPADWRDPGARMLRKHDEERLAAVAAGLDIDCDTAVLDGPTTPALREAVIEREIDLLVKTARPTSYFDRMFGSVARKLIRQCPCPVWVVRAAPKGGEAPVIAAVGPVGWGAASEDIALAERVVSLSSQLAAIQNRPLVVAHAFDPIAERVVARSGARDLRRYLDEETRYLRADLRALLTRLTVEAEVELVRGEPGKAIAELAVRRGSDTVVVGNRGRSGLAGLFIGNTAERVIDHDTTGVVTVRPG